MGDHFESHKIFGDKGENFNNHPSRIAYAESNSVYGGGTYETLGRYQIKPNLSKRNHFISYTGNDIYLKSLPDNAWMADPNSGEQNKIKWNTFLDQNASIETKEQIQEEQ